MRVPPPVMPAIVTAFTRSGALDPAAHRHNVAVLAAQGTTGFVLGGSTGEGPYLEAGERATLAAATREVAAGAFVMVGVAAESLRSASAMVGEAVDGGADAVLVMTPTTLVRHDHAAVEGFYADLADRSPIPTFLYSVPRVTAYELPMESVIRLASHGNVAGIKDSGGHPARLSTIVGGSPGEFSVYCGASAAISLSVAGGARGAITASGNYAGGLVAEVVGLARRSPTAAAEAQERLRVLSASVEAHGVGGVKHAAALAGLRPGSPRRPLRPLAASRRRSIDQALAEAPSR